MEWYQEFIATDRYLIFNFVAIVLSFLVGEMSARIMMSSLSKKKYGDMIELLEENKNNLYDGEKHIHIFRKQVLIYALS